MAMPKFVRGIGGKVIWGLGPTAISIIYDKVKRNLEKYVNEYLERRKSEGTEHLREAESSGLEKTLRAYTSRVVDEVKEKLSYLDNRVNYVQEAVNKGRIGEPSVYHAGDTARNLFNQLFNYPFKKYADIEQRVTYNSDTTRHPGYIGNGLQKVKEALDWWDSTDEWIKRLVYGAAKRVEKMALINYILLIALTIYLIKRNYQLRIAIQKFRNSESPII